MALQNATVEEQWLTLAEILVRPIAKYITHATNNCGYSGTTKYPIVKWFNHLFLNAKYEASKEYKPHLCEATIGSFADKYWKSMKTDIETH